MVQEIEDLKAELEADPFRDLCGLVQVEIPLDYMRTAEGVAAAGTDGSVGWNGKYRRNIGDGGAVGIAKLVDGLSDAGWPLVGEVLPGVIRAAREQRGPRPPAGVGGDAPNLPTVSQAAHCAPFREVVPDARVEVPPNIRVAGALVTSGIVRILRDRKRRRTAAIDGIGVDAVRPGEVDYGVEPVPIALPVGDLHRVVARIAAVGELVDVLECRHTASLENRVKRPVAIERSGIVSAHRTAGQLSVRIASRGVDQVAPAADRT